MPKNAGAARNNIFALPRFAFPSYYQNKPTAVRVRFQNKSDQFRMGLLQCHTVQINPRLGPEFTTFKSGKCFVIHL